MPWQQLRFWSRGYYMKKISSSPIFRSALAVFSVVLLTLGLHAMRIPGLGAPDFMCGSLNKAEVNIEISSGETGSEIARDLFHAGVVKSQEAFFRVAVGDARSQKIAPGVHRVNSELCAKDALEQLLDSSRINGLINITEGAWLSEILPQFYRAGMSVQSVSTAIRTIEKPAGFSSLEGLLFPAQYSFEDGTSAETALTSMVNRAVSEMKTVGFYSTREKFSPQQLLIIASLVQAEGNTGDFAKIAQVIRNRLLKGMPLQFDSTVHYVKKSRGSVFLSTQSTLINSPYNTYRRYGLPPGPINNPGKDAMVAAINPTPGDWLYFITVAPFDTRFTAKIDEFNSWKIEYKKNLRDGKFRSGK